MLNGYKGNDLSMKVIPLSPSIPSLLLFFKHVIKLQSSREFATLRLGFSLQRQVINNHLFRLDYPAQTLDY